MTCATVISASTPFTAFLKKLYSAQINQNWNSAHYVWTKKLMKVRLLLCNWYWGVTIIEGNVNTVIYDRAEFIRINRESEDGQRFKQDNDPKQTGKTPDFNPKDIFRGFQNCKL